MEWAPLPIASDEGFPQSFRLAFAERLYVVGLYVNVSERLLAGLPHDAVLELPLLDPQAKQEAAEEAFLVVRIARESELPQAQTIFQRKVVPGVDYAAGELALRFGELRVARRNLGGPGVHGSSVVGEVARAWP